MGEEAQQKKGATHWVAPFIETGERTCRCGMSLGFLALVYYLPIECRCFLGRRKAHLGFQKIDQGDIVSNRRRWLPGKNVATHQLSMRLFLEGIFLQCPSV